jgi:hypothetical protein
MQGEIQGKSEGRIVFHGREDAPGIGTLGIEERGAGKTEHELTMKERIMVKKRPRAHKARYGLRGCIGNNRFWAV